jgi:hypothetical protein
MTWRAFILGLLCVVGVALLDPYMSFNKGYGWNTQTHFPTAAGFLLVVLTVAANSLLRLLRPRSALSQAELMLVWCMLIVGCVVPSNLMRFWFPVLATPAYLARRPDIVWADTALKAAPSGLLLTKNPASVAAQQFLEGWRGGEGRLPWREWAAPVGHWAILIGLFALATFFLCAIMRRQWVDRERLQFPLARVPLDFTEGSGPSGWLTAVFTNRAFLLGVVGAAALSFLQVLPLLFGAQTTWNVRLPLRDMFQQTPLEQLYLENFDLNWLAIGLAYFVPADVSLSIWAFYLLGRVELQSAAWMGSPLYYGGTYSQLIRWQRAGAYAVFTVGALFMARRHLADVVARALRRRGAADDEAEPVSFALSLWGLLACGAGIVVWFVWYGMGAGAAALLLVLVLCIQFVHARIVAQSGIYRTDPLANGPGLLNALGMGHLFAPTGAAVAQMQYTIMIGGNNSMLGPAAIHAFRIGEVFERRRRLLLPALIVAFGAAVLASSWTCLHQAYAGGALNYGNVWAVVDNPRAAFELADQMIRRPEQSVVQWVPFGLGIGLTGAVMFMRARFYWWPVHPVGLLAFAEYGLDRMWFSFFLGWLVKVCFVKFGTGRLLRQGRLFFIGFILTEVTFIGAWSLARLLTGGALPEAGFWI